MSLRTTTPAIIRASNLLLDIRDLAEEADAEKRLAIGPGRTHWENLERLYEVFDMLLVKMGADAELGELDVDDYLQTGVDEAAG